MTQRFENLEFDDDGPRSRAAQESLAPRGSTGTPIRDAAWYEHEGDRAFHAYKFEQALRAYSSMLEENNALPGGWLGQVRALIEMGELKEGNVWADKALEMFPHEPNLLAAKSVASARMGKVSLALAQSDNAVGRPGITSYVWLSRAEALLAAKKKIYAQCLEKAVSQASGQTAQAWMRWEGARVLRRYRRRAQALQYATEAVERLGNEPGAWLELGFCQQEVGIGRARESFESAAQIDPENDVAKKALKKWRKPSLLGRIFKYGARGSA